MQEKRTKEIKVRLTPTEHAALLERCDRPQLAEWLREVGLNQRKRRPIPAADPELLRLLSAIGNNLNQIARWCNSPQKPIEAVEVAVLLASIDRSMEALVVSKNTSKR